MRTIAFKFRNNLDKRQSVIVEAVTMRHAMHLAAKALGVAIVHVVLEATYNT